MTALGYLLSKHLATASRSMPLACQENVSASTHCGHSCAMELLQSGVDRAVIALWLGHESVETTYIYLHADLKLKEQAMARTAPSHMPPARYRPDDDVLAFLNRL